jgi:hypothetical protein
MARKRVWDQKEGRSIVELDRFGVGRMGCLKVIIEFELLNLKYQER